MGKKQVKIRRLLFLNMNKKLEKNLSTLVNGSSTDWITQCCQPSYLTY